MEVSKQKKDEATVVSGQFKAAHAIGSLKHRRNKTRKRKLTKFERRYSSLGPLLRPEQKRIDYVLVHKVKTVEDYDDEEKKMSQKRKEDLRERFEKALRVEGFSIKEETIDGYVYKKLHCPFKRMCKEAEKVKLEMPLKGGDKPSHLCETNPTERTTFITEFIEKYFETDNEVDYISAPFKMNKIDMFEGYDNPTYFFRPAIRSLLTHHILNNIDVRDRSKQGEKIAEKLEIDGHGNTNLVYAQLQIVEDCVTDFCACCPCYPRDSENPDNIVLSKMGLPYMLLKEVYIDAYILHEDSELSKLMEDPSDDEKKRKADTKEEPEKRDLKVDPRKDLDGPWTTFWKFQPVWKIRNYFGEKIALYFAWAGLLISSLWIPTFFGLACFIYGLTVSIERGEENVEMPANLTAQEEIKWRLGQLYNTVSGSFDNDVTPFFAMLICLWGTFFLELWKRYNARLSYEWDVDQFEQNEPDRPEFFGTKLKIDPVTQQHDWFYSWKRQMLKFCISASALIFMICLVFISVAAVVVYRVIVSVDYCGKISTVSCLILTNILSALLNAVSILILGKIYDWVAWKLTEWENHRTQTQYNDALIIKLFAFSFANTYASCFYIAFFRGRFGGIFGLSDEYNDECEGDSCMSQLSFQVCVLMLAKPLPKFLKDIVLPFIRKLWRTRPDCCRCCDKGCCCCNNKVEDEEKGSKMPDTDTLSMKRSKAFLKKERYKPPLGDFTLGEYTEKVIIYGFLMLFAASFPLAPLIALIILFLDKHIDAKRLLWLNRRPVAFIAQDLGMWFGILQFVNLIGVVSNGFLIAFTSAWGLKYSIQTRLWICIGFEHIVFTLKFILAYLIPDVPKDVRLAIRREKYQVAKKFEEKNKPLDYTELVPAATYDERVKDNSANYGNFPELPLSSDEDKNGGSEPPAPWTSSKNDLSTVEEEAEPNPMSPKSSTKHKEWYEVDTDTELQSPSLTQSHGVASLRAINPEGSMLNQTASQDKLSPIVEKSSKDATKSPGKESQYSPNYLPSSPPPPTPKYHVDSDNLVSDDTDSNAVKIGLDTPTNPYSVVSVADLEHHKMNDHTAGNQETSC
ncbi:anoctamin-4-like isoform X2 [Mercenaria mercenaria]|uniref:anoctamin-4-like isoform X2 n=1 Tax=Mercenaria mercenaria TaxID=6596 RepID=UPI00234E6D70|nr:anoctamin-4-like isoform X2 [Mercenaria mercenaria]